MIERGIEVAASVAGAILALAVVVLIAWGVLFHGESETTADGPKQPVSCSTGAGAGPLCDEMP